MLRFLTTLLLVLSASACGSSDGAIGSACLSDAICESGFCLEDACADPRADADGDGLANAEEVDRGLSPLRADTDRDGTQDGDEPESDCDGDGIANALESARRDADADGVPDQYDPYDPDDHSPYCPPRTELRLSPVATPGGDGSPLCGADPGPPPGLLDAGQCVELCCAPRPTCAGDGECAAGVPCLDGVCVPPPPPADAGAVDGGGADTGATDAGGAVDAGRVDTGP